MKTQICIHPVSGLRYQIHQSIASFAKALASSGAERLTNYTVPGTDILLLSTPPAWDASFIDKQGAAHLFTLGDLKEGWIKKTDQITDAARKAGIPLVDGMTIISEKSGHALIRFLPDPFDDKTRAALAYSDWLAAAKALPKDTTHVQYIDLEEKGILIDATEGILHFETVLDGKEDRTLTATLGALEGFRTQDNGPVRQWLEDNLF